MYSNKNIHTFQDCIASLQLSKITQRTRRGQTVESQNETSCLHRSPINDCGTGNRCKLGDDVLMTNLRRVPVKAD